LPRSTSQRFSRTNGDGIDHDFGHDLASPFSDDLITLVSPANTDSTHSTSTPTYHPDANSNKYRSSSSPLNLSKRRGSRRALVDSESSSPTKSASATETFTTAPTTPEAPDSPSPPRHAQTKQKYASLSTPPQGSGVGVGVDPSPREVEVPLSAIIELFAPPRNASSGVEVGGLPTAAQVEQALASFVEKEKRRCAVIGIEWHGEGRRRATWLINQVSEMVSAAPLPLASLPPPTTFTLRVRHL
jgi:hypothetical protein